MTPRIRTVRNEKGVALPLALCALVVFSSLLLAFLSMSGHEVLIAQNLGYTNRAFYVADAGIEHAYAFLGTAPLPLANGNPFPDQAFGGGTYSVTVTQNPAGTYTFTSTGTYKDSTQTVEMRVTATPAGPGLPPLSAVITEVSHGQNETDFENSAFVTGNDESPCQGQTNTSKAGWVYGGVNSYPQFDYQGGILEGVGGAGALTTRISNPLKLPNGDPNPNYNPNVPTDDPRFNNPETLRDWVSSLASQSGVVNVSGIAAGQVTINGVAGQNHPTTLGTAAHPQITVWNPGNGTSQLTTADITGYGILILRNTTVANGLFKWMRFNKALNFYGLIIVDSPGEVEFSNGNSLHGAVIGVSTNTGIEATKLEWNKDAQLHYNCTAIQNYALPLAGGGGSSNSLTMLYWKQQ